MEVTQDMHLKMSKKIAQLTKVIYALNTKNDEHEAVVQQLKEQHEEEIQQLLKETKEKLLLIKAKVDADVSQNKKVEQLESSLKEHESMKYNYLTQFDSFKRSAEERETKLKAEHAQKMLELAHDVLQTKKDFEDKLKQYETWKDSIVQENETKMKDIQTAHQKEMDDVRSHFKDQNNDWLNEVKKLDDKYKSEVESLKMKCSELVESKSKLTDEYESKLAKAQLFYEKELEAVMKLNNISEDEAGKMLQIEKDKLRKEFAFQEAELKKQINSILSQLTEKEDEVETLQKELADMSNALKAKEGSSHDLYKQLQAAQDEAKASLAKLKELEADLGVIKERCIRQEDEMMKKSMTIGKLEATKLQNESTIQEQEGTINKLKDKLTWLEKERLNLEKQKSSLSLEQTSQLKSLEKALEDLSIEKQAMKERYNREIESLCNNASRSEKELSQKHAEEMENLRQKLFSDLATQKMQASELLEQIKQELNQKHEKEMLDLSRQRDQIQSELERIKSELTSRLKAAEDEVSRVNSLLHNKEEGLGSATGTINGLKEANNQLQQQLEKARADQKAEKSRAASLQAELDKLRLQHEASIKQAQIELQQKVDQATTELDIRWQETLRRECCKLREEINDQKESEMRAALEQLSYMKDEEISLTKAGWEKKIQDLMRQIASLRESMTANSSLAETEAAKLRQDAEAERKQLELELLKAANEYMVKIQTLESMHDDNMKRLQEQKQLELQEMEERLKVKHIQDMQTQMSAHKATVESIRNQAEAVKVSELKVQRETLEKEKDKLRDDMYEQHMRELDRRIREHESQMQTARMELERAVEISRQKEKDHALRVEDLQEEITQRERHINNLKDDAGKLQTSISHLNKEIDYKRQEIQKAKVDMQNQIRVMEKRMSEKLEQELNNLHADHLRESQELVRQFNQAQEILKDKISELQILLQDAEEKYDNRESRPEDLELIEQLRACIYEKEEQVKSLIEEKKFFQMELVNRETNFNKVFNAHPNVGILNPLDVKRRKGERASPKGTNSATNLSGRLDPLPGSPMHHSQLNPSKPLPPFTKKFVK